MTDVAINRDANFGKPLISPTVPGGPPSPLEQLRTKVRAAQTDFVQALKIEFEAMLERAENFGDEIDEVQFDGHESVSKTLGNVVKGLSIIVDLLSDPNED